MLKIFRAGMRWAILCVAAIGLSGCFDLTQRVAIGRDGSGWYEAAITAEGIVGEALRNKNANNLAGNNRAVTTTSDTDGRVTQRSVVDFKSLSNLAFSDQGMSLTLRGSSFLGLGPSEMTFRRSFAVDRARAEHEDLDQSSGMGRQIAQSLLGDHTYVFSVTLPGSIERIAPVVIGGVTIRPEVTGDFYHGHTITWRMPLYMMAVAHALSFEVDFSAYGWFSNASTRRG